MTGGASRPAAFGAATGAAAAGVARRAPPPRRAPPLGRGEQQRVQQDGDDRRRQDQGAALLRQQAERHAKPGQDEGELADLREARRDAQRFGQRAAEGAAHDQQRGQRLAHHDDRHRRQHHPGGAHEHARTRACPSTFAARPRCLRDVHGPLEPAPRRTLLAFAGVGPGQRVLDVGCGTGVTTAAAAAEVVGLDPSEPYLDHARRHRARPGAAP